MNATLAQAYAACVSLAASHYENFPVASRLLPSSMRPHIAAVYAFARVADDIADEGADPPAVRRARLLAWQHRLHQAACGASEPGTGSRDDLIFIALGHSMRELDLPLELFDDLLSAFAQDITTTRYDSWAELLDYCRRSANPIGRLVLRIATRRSIDHRMRCAPLYSSRISGRTSVATGMRAACTSRATHASRRVRRSTISQPRA